MNENDVLGFNPQDLFSSSNSEKSGAQSNYASYLYRTRPSDVKEEVDKNHIYRATIKVIYNPLDFRKSFLDQQSYGLQDANGFFNVISKLTINDKDCPIFKAWKKCRYARQNDGSFNTDFDRTLWLQQAKEEDGGKALFDKRQARYCVVQILEDKNQPELEGSFKLWKLPQSIYDLIKQKQDPTDKKKCSIPVMDLLFGRSIDIEVKPGPGKPGDVSYTRQVTYSGELSEDTVCCVAPDKSPLLNSTEQAVLDTYVEAMSKVWKMKANNEEEYEARETMKAEVDSDANTAELRKIYARVLEQVKEWAPKLDLLNYHDWTPEVTARVENWIKVVLDGGNPAESKVTTPTIENAVPDGAESVGSEANSTVSFEAADPFAGTPTSTEDDSDLPF